MYYSVEITFLRSIAILSVIAYHFFPTLMTYGFLGVDIFFIISGYLISKSLLQKNNIINFQKIINFYVKRIKRIIPALFFFFSITTLILYPIFLKSDFQRFAESLIASKTFWANIFFWRDGGYFGYEDKLKPLLHIWSLAVELQFYIVFPLILLVSSKLKIEYSKLIFLISLISLITWWFLNKIGGENPAFFLSPSRFWQFGAGSLIAFYIFKENFFLKKNKILNEFFFYISIFLLIFCLFINLDKKLQTLAITIVTIVYILSSNNLGNYFFSNLINNKKIIFIGKISFSLYLYHWLIIVILNYYFIENVPLIIKIIGIFFSIFLANLSYKYIEKPFRKTFNFKYTLALVLMCTISNLSILLINNKFKNLDFADKISYTSGTNFRCEIDDFKKYGSSKACILVNNSNFNEKIALVGNSHAQMYAPLFFDLATKNRKNLILVPLNSCLPTEQVNISLKCINLAKKNNNTVIQDKSISRIFISSTWYSDQYVDFNGEKKKYNEYLKSMNSLIKKFERNGKKVYLFSPIAIPNKNLTSILPRLIRFKKIDEQKLVGLFSIEKNEYDNKFLSTNNYFNKMLNDRYIKVYNDLCDINKCYFIKKNNNYFSDGNHLSKFSLKYLVSTKNQINSILSQK